MSRNKVASAGEKIVDDIHAQLVAKVGRYNRPAHQSITVSGIHRPKVILFDKFTASALATGGTASLILTRESLGQIRHLEVEYVVNNTSSSNTVTLLPTSVWADVDIYSNGGQEVIQHSHDVPYWAFNCNYSSEQMSSQSMITNTNATTYLAGTALGVSSTSTYYQHLPNNFLEFCGVVPQLLNGNFKFDFKFHKNSCVAAGTEVPNIMSMNLILWDIDLSDFALTRQKQIYQNYQANFTEWIPARLGNVTLTAGAASTFKLDSIQGTAAAIMFGPRASTAEAASALLTYTALGTMAADATVQLKHNTDTIFNAPIKLNTLRYIENASNFSSSPFFATIQINMLCLSDPTVFQTGFVDGFLTLDNDILVEITPGSGFATGSYDLDIWVALVRRVQIDGGKVKLLEEGI